MKSRHATAFGPFTWWTDPRQCPHSDANACPTCDHDGYYRSHLPAELG